ncbi:MAG: neutral/alkaline non-lysosomal ceramidase N-terminal domain-containing protein [Pirellulales bacterium]
MDNQQRLTGMGRLATSLVTVLALSAVASALDARAADWRAGAATVDITPQQSMWMSGYASRTAPSEGTLHPLWAKALVLEDGEGGRAVLVTLDLVGIGRELSVEICQRLTSDYELSRDQIALCCSHTHTGPVVGRNLGTMYFIDDAQWRLIDDYAARLADNVVDVVGRAIAALEPARVSWGGDTATFAVNRRNNKEADVETLRAEGRLVGPSDHDVPVLAVHDEQGRLKAIAFGYACHATTLSIMRWTGDYAGFAQVALEQRYPDAVALFWAGCGADQNPLPRRTVALAQQYGLQLADAVDRALRGTMQPIDGELSTTYREVALPLDTLPTRADLEQQAQSENRYEASRAAHLLAKLDGGTPLSPTYPYPVETWQLGSGPTWIVLGGEVVVDFALRLKSELDDDQSARGDVWVAGYANDVMAYIPSRRVLGEGGYEGGGAMVYYGLPTVWAPTVERVIVDAVHKQLGK